MTEAYQSSYRKYSEKGTLRPMGQGPVTRFSVSQIGPEMFTIRLMDMDPKVNKKLVRALKSLPREDRRFDNKLGKWALYSSESLRDWLEVTRSFSPLIQWGCRNCDARTLMEIVDDYERGGDQQ